MKIKEVRKNKHMTQKELAEKIGVTKSVISRYESGSIIPPVDKIQNIAEVLDVSVDELLDNNSNAFTIDIEYRSKSQASESLRRLVAYTKAIYEYSNNIREIRRSINMTQKELAEKIGVDCSVISKYESGRSIPPSNKMKEIADVLNVSVDFLLDNNPENTKIHKIDSSTSINNIREIRRSLNMTQRELAEKVGVTFSVISKYESGAIEPSLDKMKEIADALNVPLEIVFNKNDLAEKRRLHACVEGCCQLCGKKGSLEDLENEVLPCKNCHRKVDVLQQNEEDI